MLTEIIDIINSHDVFLITAHVRVDGDALGSELAMYHLIRDLGKTAVIYNQDKTPEIYHFLPGSDAIIHTLDSVEKFDVVFVLDCSELERVGDKAHLIGTIDKIINIDHHISNGFFTDLHLIDHKASSTGEIIYRLLEKLDITITKDIAINIYTAIMTDTGSFRYSNTGSETFRIAADLLERGAEVSVIAEHVYETRPLVQLILLEKVLSTLEIDSNVKVASAYIMQKVLQDLGASKEHTEGFVELIRSIAGVNIAVFYQELSQNNFKISLRSKGNINVEQIARALGGGGHLNASACRIQGDIETAKESIMKTIRTYIL